MRSDEWNDFAGELRFHRLSGIALAAVEAGVLVLPEARETDLWEQHKAAMLWALTLESTLVRLARDVAGDGVRFVVLKGPAVAHTVYPDPSWRAFGDLDLLVGGRHWGRMCALLEASGFRRRVPEPRPGFNEQFGQGTTYVNGDGLEVDLHRRLVFGAFGAWIDTDELIDRAVPFRLGGRELRRLDDSALQVHACVHASLGARRPLLLPLRDVIQIAQSGLVRWDDLEDAVRRWRCRVVIEHAVKAVSDRLGVDAPAELRSICVGRAPARERRALSAYTTERRGRSGKARSMLRVIPGVRAKSRFVWALVLPDREFLAVREGSSKRSAYVRRWMVPLRWLTARAKRSQV